MDRLLQGAPMNLESMNDIFDTSAEIIAFLRDESLPVLNDLLINLNHAVAKRESDQCAKIAHKIRGGAVAIGALEISMAMQKIQEQAKYAEWDSVAAWLDVATSSVDRINAWVAGQA